MSIHVQIKIYNAVWLMMLVFFFYLRIFNNYRVIKSKIELMNKLMFMLITIENNPIHTRSSQRKPHLLQNTFFIFSTAFSPFLITLLHLPHFKNMTFPLSSFNNATAELRDQKQN